MEKRITFYPPQTWRGRFLGTILTLVAFLLGATQAEAQTVHIALDNGNLLTGMGPFFIGKTKWITSSLLPWLKSSKQVNHRMPYHHVSW